jgi:hypothetical protein
LNDSKKNGATAKAVAPFFFAAGEQAISWRTLWA